MGIEVRAPDGRIWKVRRSLGWPRWRRWNVDLTDGFDLLSVGSGDNPLAELALGIALLVLLAVFIVVFLPLMLFIGELLLLVPAALLVLRPWHVIAETHGPPPERLHWRVRGWGQSRRGVEEVARELGHGVEAAPEAAE